MIPRPIPSATIARIALVGVALAVAACSDPSTPLRPAPGASAAVNPASAFDEFINAQGSYCDDDTIPCGAPPYDIGFIPCYGDNDPVAPCFIADFAGVNARYWARNGFQPAQPSFAANGTVSELLLPDGRRRLKANIRSTNTFTALYPESGSLLAPVLGADFFEYPIAGEPFDAIPDVPPLPSSVSAEIDVILPRGFVGQPDMLAIWAGVLPAEVIRWRVITEASGVLRSDYSGIAGGTPVRLGATFDWRGGAGAVTRLRVLPMGAATAARRSTVAHLPRITTSRLVGRRITR